MLAKLIDELQQIKNLDPPDEEFNNELYNALEEVMVEFRERNMKGYVYVIYVGNNLYKIGKTGDLQRRWTELKEERLVRLIKAENITEVEGQLHRMFRNKRQTSSQELFRLNDQDLLTIHEFPDEWEDDKIF